MKNIWWIVYVIFFNVFLIGYSIAFQFTEEGMKVLLPNYILIETAFLAVIFAAIAIQKENELLKKETCLIGIIANASIVGIFASIFALYFCYYTAGGLIFTATIVFYISTICISLSIFGIASLTAKIIGPINQS